MEAIKKQAARLREQVAKQQQAVWKHLGYLGDDSIIVDEDEFRCYQQLQSLYESTRAAKHLQKNVVRGVEGYISTSLKQKEIAQKLAEVCCKYGNENKSTNFPLATVAVQFGTSHSLMEKERESLLGTLGDQVSEPLRAMITGAPIEDARHLTHRYEKLRQEVEAQAAEVLRRRSKTKDSDITTENCMKLRNAEERLTNLKSALVALGREATAALLAVENQQQQITVQRLFSMVDAERCYHQHVLAILDKLHSEMIQEEQQNESSSTQSVTLPRELAAQHAETSNGSDIEIHSNQKDGFFIAKVIHSFDAEAEGELSLSVGDYVVVRQVVGLIPLFTIIWDFPKKRRKGNRGLCYILLPARGLLLTINEAADIYF